MDEKTLSFKKKFLISLIVLAVFLGLLEVGATIYYRFGLTAEKRDLVENAIGLKRSSENNVLRYIAHPYFNYVGNPEYQFPDGVRPHNSRGFRQPEWTEKKAGVIRIAALGGSTTYGMYSEDGKDVWPALLEKALCEQWGEGIEVINLGLPAYTTHEIIGVTAMLVPVLKPDIVLIHVGANDAFAACYPDEGGPDNTIFRFSWNYRTIPGVLRFFMRHSRLVRIFGLRYASSKGFLPGDMFEAMQYRPYPNAKAKQFADEATGKYFRRNVSSLIALVKDMGAVPVLMTHPLNPKWEYPKSVFYQGLVKSHRRNNGIIKEMGNLRNVPVIDLYERMRDVVYFTDAIHESDPGMVLKVSLILPVMNDLIGKIKQK
jgi:lysophospholipase L1-like esterase